MGKENRIKVTGQGRREIDIDLLVQAMLAITEQRLQNHEVIEAEQPGEASA